MTEQYKSKELTLANYNWLNLTKPLGEIREEYKIADDNLWANFIDPDYISINHVINAFEKCAKGELNESELFRWVQQCENNHSIQIDSAYLKLIGSIYNDFEDFDRNPDEEMPDQAYVKETLEKLRNAQPETLA